MHLLIKSKESVKVHIKGERIETETMENCGGEMCTKTGMKNSSTNNFVYLLSVIRPFIEETPTILCSY